MYFFLQVFINTKCFKPKILKIVKKKTKNLSVNVTFGEFFSL